MANNSKVWDALFENQFKLWQEWPAGPKFDQKEVDRVLTRYKERHAKMKKARRRRVM